MKRTLQHKNSRTNIILFLLSVLLVCSSVSGFFHYGSFYYISLAAIGLFLIFQPSFPLRWGMRPIVFFLITCASSLIINNPPSFFNAWARYLVYVLMLMVVSPIITNKYIGAVRSRVFMYCLITLSILSVGSFFAYFLDINMFVRDGLEMEIRAGTFSGFMRHSMMLGPLAAVSSVFLFSLLLSERKGLKRLIFLVGSVLSMGASVLSASRIAVAAGIASMIVLIVRFFKERISKAFAILLVIIALGVATFPMWGSLTDFLIDKNSNNEELGGSFLYSRQQKIIARITEFKDSPIVGIGFCTVDPRYDVVNYENGQIEPGSSWLAVASMTGILGFLSFLIIIIKAFCQAWRSKDRKIAGLLSAMYSFFLIHMLVEGYIMAPSSFLCMFFWLLTGTINHYHIIEVQEFNLRKKLNTA